MRKRLSQLLDRLELHLKLLEAYLIVKDPSAPKSAEAFDGLRLKIDGAYRARRRHLAQLAELDRVSRTTTDVGVFRAKTAEFLGGEGVQVIDTWDPRNVELFDVHGDRTESMRVVSPAYVEVHENGTFDVIKRGAAEAGPDDENREIPPQRQPSEEPAGDSDPRAEETS